MQLLTIPDVAKILNCSVERAYELARTDTLPVVCLGRQLRVDPNTLNEWVRQGGKPLAGGWKHDK